MPLHPADMFLRPVPDLLLLGAGTMSQQLAPLRTLLLISTDCIRSEGTRIKHCNYCKTFGHRTVFCVAKRKHTRWKAINGSLNTEIKHLSRLRPKA